jgi:ribonucleotide monophosphatase NagD (HAD superfamily)
LTRNFVTSRLRQSMYWIGPERDNSIYRGLDAKFAPLEQADYIVCTRPFDDETESAEDNREMMMQALARKLTLVCANPDIVVERGDRLIYCAGAIAELYRELGGDVVFETPLSHVLAIGDSVRTDLAGAHAYGID